MKRGLLLLVMALSLSGLAAGQVSASTSATATTERLRALELNILAQLNATRIARGVRPVVPSAALQNAAIAHSRSMLADGFFAHESSDGSPFSDRVKRFYSVAGFDRWSVGENLLYTTGEIDAAQVIKAWLDSPGHRANMLSPSWREVGIGALHASEAGGAFEGEATLVITMDFGARSGGAVRPLKAIAATSTPKPRSLKVAVRLLPGPAANGSMAATATADAIEAVLLAATASLSRP